MKKINTEPLKIEYPDGSYIIIRPMNALDIMGVEAQLLAMAGSEPFPTVADILTKAGANTIKDIVVKRVVEAKIADREWKQGDGVENLLEMLPAAVFIDLAEKVIPEAIDMWARLIRILRSEEETEEGE